MTLHWWMHWFWVTYQLWVCYCTFTPSLMHSLSLRIREGIKLSNGSENIKIPSSFKNITIGLSSVNTSIPIKLRKPIKKHEAVVTTVSPIVKASTVINYNESNVGLYIADNQTAVNISYENNNHGIPFRENGNGTSQNLVVNSERFGDQRENLSAASITGITLGCVIVIGIACAASFIIYRNYGFNRPQVLNDHCSNPDSSGYIDDSSVRENSEEMYSLDNDSFLNSLEAMTIQNLWTDSVKHTKL